jgi:hypothetical protein
VRGHWIGFIVAFVLGWLFGGKVAGAVGLGAKS